MANPLGADPLSPDEHKPFPQLAEAIRSRIESTIAEWIKRVRRAIPSVRALSDVELRDDLPAILDGMADFLSAVNGEARRLTRASPAQGSTRFHQNYDIQDLMYEDRLLRVVIVEQVEAQLGRGLAQDEAVTLHIGIDVMLQRAVAEFVNLQNQRLRAGAESELKYLSFLSHDLNNNLGSVTLFLQGLRKRLAEFPEFAQDVHTIEQAQESILKTISGMGRLLQSERLRREGVKIKLAPVHLHRLASNIAQPMLRMAAEKGLRLVVDCPPDAVVNSDGELITLVLQNLLGNAVKYASKGEVRITCRQQREGSGNAWTLSIIDEGPGIAQEHVERIFQAFKRGESYGQSGVGLGLAIASQAAKLLGAKLELESVVGVGTKFHLALPSENSA